MIFILFVLFSYSCLLSTKLQIHFLSNLLNRNFSSFYEFVEGNLLYLPVNFQNYPKFITIFNRWLKTGTDWYQHILCCQFRVFWQPYFKHLLPLIGYTEIYVLYMEMFIKSWSIHLYNLGIFRAQKLILTVISMRGSFRADADWFWQAF